LCLSLCTIHRTSEYMPIKVSDIRSIVHCDCFMVFRFRASVIFKTRDANDTGTGDLQV
jgi:hypothetical protein